MFRLSIKTMNTSIQLLVDSDHPDSEKAMTRLLIIVERWEALKIKLNGNMFKLDGSKPLTEKIDEEIISPVMIRNQQNEPTFDFDHLPAEVKEDIALPTSDDLEVEQMEVKPKETEHEEITNGHDVSASPASKKSGLRMKLSFKRKKAAPAAGSSNDKQAPTPTTPKKKSKKLSKDKGKLYWTETSISSKLQEIRVVFHWVKHKLVIV